MYGRTLCMADSRLLSSGVTCASTPELLALCYGYIHGRGLDALVLDKQDLSRTRLYDLKGSWEQ